MMIRKFVLYIGLLLTLASIVLVGILTVHKDSRNKYLLTSYETTYQSTKNVYNLSIPKVVSQSILIQERSIQLHIPENNSNTFSNKSAELSLSSLRAHFPNIFIVGFGKAGTKTVFEYLKRHPQISGPPKEMRFLSRNYQLGLTSYLNSLPQPALNGYVIEKSPDYILVDEVPDRLIYSTKLLDLNVFELKFVIVLRNPINRAVSEYLEWNVQKIVNKEHKLPPFEAMLTKKPGNLNFNIKFINTSCYSYHIERWLKYFSEKQICYVDGDEFIHEPYITLHKLELCLDINPFFQRNNFLLNPSNGFYCYTESFKNYQLCMGKDKGRPHPSIEPHIYDELVKYFRKWDKKLSYLTKRNFSWYDNY